MIRAKGFLGKGRVEGGRTVEGGERSGPGPAHWDWQLLQPHPSLKDATSPTTHPYFVPCPPHPGVISPGHQHCLGRAHSLPQPAHSSYPSIRLIMWESAGGWEVAEEWGSSWGHWNQVLLWIVIVFALFSPLIASAYIQYTYITKPSVKAFLCKGFSQPFRKRTSWTSKRVGCQEIVE